MLKGGFPPIYPIDLDSNMKIKDHIKRNFSSNNIIDINTILLKKKSTSLVSMLNLSEHVESDDKNNNNDDDDDKNNNNNNNNDNNNDDNNNKKKKNRNFKNEQIDNKNFINYISDLKNIRQISRVKKSSKTNKKSSKTKN
jgi:hypothetical protein